MIEVLLQIRDVITIDEILTEATGIFGFKKSTDEMKRIIKKEIIALRTKPSNLINFREGSYFIHN